MIIYNEIKQIESEIIKIDSYLTSKFILNMNTYRPHTEDEDQHLRKKLEILKN